MSIICLTNGCIICTRNTFISTYQNLGNQFSIRYLNDLDRRILEAKTITQLKFCTPEHYDECAKMRADRRVMRRKSLALQLGKLKNAYISLALVEQRFIKLINDPRSTSYDYEKMKIEKDHAARVVGQRERRIREDYAQDTQTRTLIPPLERLIEKTRTEAQAKL